MRWDSYENFNQHHEDSVDGVCSRPTGGGGGLGGWGVHSFLPKQIRLPRDTP